MPHLRTLIVAPVALLAFGLTSARAQEGRRLALVIGIGAYRTLPELTNAVNDAYAVEDALEEKASFDVTSILDAGSTVLRRSVERFAADVQANDVVLIYYAGHGVQVGGRNWLLPSDFPDDAGQLEAQALAADELLRLVGAHNPTIKLLILDACRTSPLREVRSSGLAMMEPQTFGPGTRIEFAASAGQAAQDGLFTRHLVIELSRPGQDIDDVFQAVRRDVAAESQGQQTTLSASQLTMNFYFIPAQRKSPGEALADLQRVASEKPRGELGQTDAVQAMIQQNQSLAGTEALAGLALHEGSFSRGDFSRASLVATDFRGSVLRDARLSDADLALAALDSTDLTGATAEGARLIFASARGATFTNGHLAQSRWLAVPAAGANFAGADLHEAGFLFADLRGARFDGANLTGASFIASDLRGATFEGATMQNTNLTGARLDLAALSAPQRAGACVLDVPPTPGNAFGYVFSSSVIEPIANSRFQGGVEYSRFDESQHVFRLPKLPLGTCETVSIPKGGWFPLWSNRGETRVREDVGLRVPHDVLEQSGRRTEIRKRIADQLEWLWPRPRGTFATTIAAADLTSGQGGTLAGSWTVDFLDDGTLRVDAINRAAATAQYEFDERNGVTFYGGSGMLGCAAGPAGAAEYRWFWTIDDKLKLVPMNPDSCAGRALLLQSHALQRREVRR